MGRRPRPGRRGWLGLVVLGGSFLAGVVVSKPALILPPLGFGAVFVGGVEEFFDVTNDAWLPAVFSGVIFSEAVAGSASRWACCCGISRASGGP